VTDESQRQKPAGESLITQEVSANRIGPEDLKDGVVQTLRNLGMPVTVKNYLFLAHWGVELKDLGVELLEHMPPTLERIARRALKLGLE